MAFDVRCVKCSAKLRFDEAPTPGDPIECPKCETTFPAPPLAGATDKKPEEPKKSLKQPKKIRAKEREHFSSILLLLIVGSCMAVLIGGLMGWSWILFRAAKAEDMLACVPDQFNVIRGVNLKAMANYPKMKQEQDKFYDAEAQAVFSDCAKKLGLQQDSIPQYYVVAKEAGRANVPTLMLFLTYGKFDPADLGGGSPVPLPGRRGAMAVCPTNRLVAVAWGGNEQAVLSAVASNAQSKPSDGMHDKVGTCGRMAIRGHIWTLIRPVGGLQNYFKSSGDMIKDDGAMKKLRDSFAESNLFASWTSFGSGGVRFGAGMNLPDRDAAKELVKDMKDGPLGKGDESEPPNQIKQVFNFLTVHKEFLQYLEYRSTGECAYMISKIADPEKARDAMNVFNNASRGTGGGGGFGQR